MPSPSIRLQDVSFAHTDAAPLLSDVTLHLAPGWTGVVGPNGAGKSTLLALVAGALRPTDGTVHRDPQGARIAVCPQEVERPGAAEAALADADTGLARKLLGLLELDPTALARWDTLSPGERKRWQVGAALAAEPDVLLLDEPTNHLDAAARASLVAALKRFRGVGLVVSHDRALLEALTHATVRVFAGEARRWPGAYGAARAAWEAEEAQAQAARTRAKEVQAHTAAQVQRARQSHAAATAQRSTRVRMRNEYDSEARSLGADFRAEQGQKAAAKLLNKVKRLEARAQDAVAQAHVPEAELGRSVFVGFAPCPQPLLAWLDAPDGLRAGDVPLLDGPLTLGLARDARVRLEGPNGAGKSTLVRALVAAARVPAERLLYLPQELTEAEAAGLLARVRALPPEERGRVLSLVAALGSDPGRLLLSARPSPGEARKLALALGLGTHAWGLVLDEPTNHLDLPTVERLEAALAEYPGALLLVSHDVDFARACTTRVWRVEGRRVEERV